MYSVTYRRKFWPLKTVVRGVLGHSYHSETDKMWLHTATGGREIREWKACEIFLGPDWKAHVEQLEKDHLTKSAKAE